MSGLNEVETLAVNGALRMGDACMKLIHDILYVPIVLPSLAVIALLVPLLALRWFRVAADRKRTEWLILAAMFFKAISMFSLSIARDLSLLRPLKFDLYVFHIDSFFGNPSFRLGHVVAAHSWLWILLNFSYDTTEMAVFGVFAAYLYLCSEAETIRLVKTFLFNIVAAVPIYLLFPVCGPRFAFPSFPALPPTPIIPHMQGIAAAPNGIPSVHTSTALLILWFLWRWPWGRVAGLICLLLTVLATLGGGQHYLFDLICSIPYTGAILWAVHKLDARSAAKKKVKEEISKYSCSS